MKEQKIFHKYFKTPKASEEAHPDNILIVNLGKDWKKLYGKLPNYTMRIFIDTCKRENFR